MADAIGTTVTVEKVRCCLDRGSYTADMISKGNMAEVRGMMPLRDRMCEVPGSILSWVCNPTVDMEWSKAILADIEAGGVEVISRD